MIEKDKPSLSIGKQCKLLSMSRSSFYDQPKGETAMNLMLMRQIDEQFLKNAILRRPPASRDIPSECTVSQWMTWHLRSSRDRGPSGAA